MELLEDAIDLLSGDSLALVGDFQLDGIVLLPALNTYFRVGRRIFRGVVEEVEERLLEQHGIEIEHRKVCRDLDLHAVRGENLAGALQDRAHNLTNIVAARVGLDKTGLKLGHIEQIGNKPVEPLRLLDDSGEQLRLT